MAVYAPLSAKAFLTIAKAISTAALDPAGWQDVLVELSRELTGIRTHFIFFDSATDHAHRSYYVGYDPATIEDYDRHWGADNAWAPGFAAHRTGEVVASQQMLPDEALKKTAFYHEWVVPQEDVALGGGAILDKSVSGAVLIGGNVRRSDGFESQERWLDVLVQMMPLMRQAVEINKAVAGLKFDNLLLRSGQDPLGTAVLVLRRDRRLVQANPVAERLLDDGVVVRTDQGARVRLTDAVADLALDRSLEARPGLGAQSLQLAAPDGASLTAQVLVMGEEVLDSLPFLAHGLVTLPLTILIISPAVETTPRSRLMREFGLTRAEMEVAVAFAKGATLMEIAESRNAQISTVRQQIKVAMSKTDTRRQVELALLVYRRLHGPG